MSYENENEEDGGDFLGYQGSRGGGSKFLKSWKKRPTKKLNFWLHTRFPPKRVWRHGFHQIVIRKAEGGSDEEVKRVWGSNLVCHESEKTLEKQYRRDKETGEREVPPTTCAMCLLIEWVRGQVLETMRIVAAAREKGATPEKIATLVEGRIGPTTALFQFDDEEDPKFSVTVHAGGLAGLFNDDDLDDYWKKELRKARISLKEAWKEAAAAKLNYLIQLVDDDDPGAGVQKTFETSLVGDKIRQVSHDAMASLGKEGGNPFKRPFCFQVEHCPDEKEFGKKYAVRRMDLIKLRPEIAELIQETEPIDVERDVRRFSPSELRTQMEAALVCDLLPLGEFFDRAAEPPENEEAEPPPKASPKAAKPAPKAAKPEPEEELVACDNPKCGKPIRISDAKCEHCGEVYREEEPAKPEPPKLKSRAEVLAEKKAAEAKAAKPEAKSSPEPADDSSFDDDADIPF